MFRVLEARCLGEADALGDPIFAVENALFQNALPRCFRRNGKLAKLQAPSSKLQKNPKLQIPKPAREARSTTRVGVGRFTRLEILVLVLGIWSLELLARFSPTENVSNPTVPGGNVTDSMSVSRSPRSSAP